MKTLMLRLIPAALGRPDAAVPILVGGAQPNAHAIAAVLRQARILDQWHNQWDEEENAVSEQFSRLYLNNPLEREISSAIISEDALDDNASPELAAIRRKIRMTELKIR